MTDDDILASQWHFTMPFDRERKLVIIEVININD